MNPRPRPKSISLSPSSADTWAVCTAQPRFVWDNWHKITHRDTGASLEGQLAHKVCECMLRGEPLPLGHTPDMVDYAEDYVAFIEEIEAGMKNPMRFVELKLPLYYQLERNSFVDCALVEADGTKLHIVDYKYGFMPVHAHEKRQTGIYLENVKTHLASFVDITPDTEVSMSIFQPRIGDGQPDTWTTTYAEVKAFLARAVDVATETILYPAESAKAPEFHPGDDVCHFCDAKDFCTARAQWVAKDFEVLDDLITTPKQFLDEGPIKVLGLAPPETLSDEHIEAALAIKDSVIKWFEGIKDHAYRSGLEGKHFKGWKIVEGKGSRSWADKGEAEKFLKRLLKKEAVKTELISPHAAETKLKGKLTERSKKKLASLVIRHDGNPTLAPETDNRPALGEQNLHEYFPDLAL